MAVEDHPPGTIALSVGDLARYHDFTMAIRSTIEPPGTVVHMYRSLSMPANLNNIVREMRPESEWLWIQADDQVWEPDALMRLLDREVDVVVPLITRRHPPFSTLVFKEETELGFKPYAYDELPARGLLEVHSCGSGGMLVRRHVLDKIREWQGHDRLFEYLAGEVPNEDTEFCRKLREVGVKIYCDVEVTLGHCGMFIAWPKRSEDGKWGINFQMGDASNGLVQGVFLQPGERPPGA